MLRIQKKQSRCDVHSHTTTSLPIQSLGGQCLHITDQGREDRSFSFSSLFNTLFILLIFNFILLLLFFFTFILLNFFKDIMSKYP